jgi:hypothetical protein
MTGTTRLIASFALTVSNLRRRFLQLSPDRRAGPESWMSAP